MGRRQVKKRTRTRGGRLGFGFDAEAELAHPNCRCVVTGLPDPPPGCVGRTILALGPDVRMITQDPPTRNEIEIAPGEYVPGLRRMGEIKLEGVFDPKRSELLEAWMDPTKRDKFQIQMLDGTRYDFQGYVTNLKDTADGATVQIRPYGKMKERKPMPKKMPVGLKRFYVGSNNVTADWTHAKLADAVEQARKLVTKEGYDEAFVVEIKRVVRRKEQPIVVEPFKS